MIRDRKALLISLLMPFILISILGFSVGKFLDQDIHLEAAHIAIVNHDSIDNDLADIKNFLDNPLMTNAFNEQEKQEMLHSMKELDFTNIFLHEVLEDEKIKEFISYQVEDEETAKKRLNNGELTALIVLPERFSYNTWINLYFPFRNPVKVEIWKNPDQELKAGIVESIVTGYTERISAGIIAKNAFLEAAIEANAGTKSYDQLAFLIKHVMEQPVNELHTEFVSIHGKNKISGFQYYAAAMAAMFILFNATQAATYSLDEKRFFTWERMKTAGIPIATILSGRFIATSLFTFIQLSFLIISSTIIFHVEWGDWPHVLLITAIISFPIGSLAVLLSIISLISNNERVSLLFQSLFIPLMSVIGGSFVPNASMPDFIKNLGDLTVNGAALQGYMKVMQGYSISDLSSIYVTLLLFGMTLMIISFGILKRREV